MPDEIVLRFSVRDDGSPVIERINQKVKQTTKETQALAPGIENARRSVMDFASENAGLIAVLTGTALALKKLYDTAREGAEIEYTRVKFERLAESIGTTSDALLGELRTATRGTLSDMEAMALAADLLALGLAKNSDEAVRLAKVQSGLGMDMNQLVLTLTNQTTMRFDALGVSVDGFDEKVKQLKATGMSTNEAFKEAFLQQAEEQLEKVGNAADEDIGAFKRLEAQMKNNRDTAKAMSAEALAPLVRYFADSTEKINENKEILRQLNEELYKEYSAHKVLTPEMQALIEEYKNSQAAIDAQTASLANNGEQAVLTAEQLKEITDVNKGMLALIGDIQSEEEKYSKKYTEITNDMNLSDDERMSKLGELEAEHQRVNNEILSGLVERKLMQDGVLTDDEFEWLIKKREEWGLYSAETVAKARAVWQEADKITASLNSIPRDIQTNITANFSQAYSARMNAMAAHYRDAPAQSNGGVHIISPAASPEAFIPNQGGSFVPNADKSLIDYKKMARAFTDALNRAGG